MCAGFMMIIMTMAMIGMPMIVLGVIVRAHRNIPIR
jgi:hypothetical protein